MIKDMKVLWFGVTKPNVIERAETIIDYDYNNKISKEVEKINSIIKSCETFLQLESCQNIIMNFKKKYPNEGVAAQILLNLKNEMLSKFTCLN